MNFYKLRYFTCCKMFLTCKVRVVQRVRAQILGSVLSEFTSLSTRPRLSSSSFKMFAWNRKVGRAPASQRPPLKASNEMGWGDGQQRAQHTAVICSNKLLVVPLLLAAACEVQMEKLQPAPTCN